MVPPKHAKGLLNEHQLLRTCVDLEFIDLLGPSTLNICPNLLFIAKSPADPRSEVV